MREILNALGTIVDKSAGMNPKMRREFRSLIAEGFELDAQSRASAAAERAKIDAAVLPECAGFQGTGTRCTSCRIRKAMHD
jgi:hypothetical protein